jgi:hypothetical protein
MDSDVCSHSVWIEDQFIQLLLSQDIIHIEMILHKYNSLHKKLFLQMRLDNLALIFNILIYFWSQICKHISVVGSQNFVGFQSLGYVPMDCLWIKGMVLHKFLWIRFLCLNSIRNWTSTPTSFLRVNHVGSRNFSCVFHVFHPNDFSSSFTVFYNPLFCTGKPVRFLCFYYSCVSQSCDPKRPSNTTNELMPFCNVTYHRLILLFQLLLQLYWWIAIFPQHIQVLATSTTGNYLNFTLAFLYI